MELKSKSVTAVTIKKAIATYMCKHICCHHLFCRATPSRLAGHARLAPRLGGSPNGTQENAGH